MKSELRTGNDRTTFSILASLLVFSTVLGAVGGPRALAASRLEVEKSIRGGLTRVNSGLQFTYVLSYRAASTTTNFYGAYLTDIIPPELTYISSVGTPHTSNIVYTAGTRTLRVNFMNPLPAGATGEIEVNVRFPNGTTPDRTFVTNMATAVASNSPPYDSARVSIMATASNRAAATKTLVGSSVPLNQNVSYTVTVNNNLSQGTLNITNITMTDTLPPGSVFIAASGSGVYDSNTHTVVWTTSTLGVSSFSRTVTIRFPAPPFALGSRVTNRVAITGTPMGKTPTNWFRAITNTIVAPTTASTFTKSVSEARYVYEGKPVNKTFNFTVNNTGNTPITDVVVTDEIKPELKVTRIQTGNFSGTPAGLEGTIGVYYQTTGGGGWLGAPGNPYAGNTNAVILPSTLGLASNAYITALRWVYGEIPVNYSIASLSFQADVMTVDRNGDPVVAGDAVTNRGDLTYTSFTGSVTRTSTVTLPVLSARPVVQLTKAMTNATPVMDSATITFRLTLANRTEAAAALRNPKLADLLDSYLTYVPGSWRVQSAPAGAPAPAFTSTPNYNGTGRTLLAWDWSSYSLPTNRSIEIRFRATLAPGTLYGGKTNEVSLIEWDNPNLDTNATLYGRDVNDLNGNGSTNDTIYFQRYGYSIFSVAAMDSYKWVKGELDTNWHRYPESGYTVPGGGADYRMTVKNIGNVPIRNIKVLDILPFVDDAGVIDLSPRESEWRPSLAAPITAPPGVTVCYSEEGNPTRTNYVPSGPSGAAEPYWSANPPADFTRTRSVKFEFGATVVQPNQELEFGWPMRAPVGAPASGEIAWNSFGYVGTRTDTGGELLPSEPIKVGIEIKPDTNAVYGDYVWFDEDYDGIQDGGEGGINGIRVHLWQDSGPGGIPDDVRDPAADLYVGYTITGDDYDGNPGYYLFPNLDRGYYYSVFEVPAGAVVSPSDQGGDNALDSDVASMSGSNYWTAITWLDDAEHDQTWDLGLWVDEYEIELIKLAGSAPDGTVLWVEGGQPVRYTYQVLNRGNLDLVNIRVRDDRLGLIGIIPRLGFGQSATLTSTPVNISADVTNIGSVRARPAVPGGGEIPGLPEATDDDDAVVRVLARIGDRVWFDYDGDGIQDGGETGVGGVRVFLLNNLGVIVATNTTDAGGLYRFTVPPGSYEAQFDLTSVDPSYKVSPRGPTGVKDATDSDANPVTGHTELTAIVANESDYSWDMGLWQPSSIGDFVWYDNNIDGLQSGLGEGGAAGIRVFLRSAGGQAIATNITAANGSYLFDNLVPGVYSVQFDLTSLPPGYRPTTRTGNLLDADNSDADPNTGLAASINLLPNTDIREVDFGIWANGEIGDLVWYDANENGRQDPGETGVPGVTVRLYRGGAPIATSITDGLGKYLFDNLPPGDYQVGFDLATIPVGYKPTARGPAGSSDPLDSDPENTTGLTEIITLSSDEEDLTWDFGLVRMLADVSLTKTAAPVPEYPPKWSIPISKGAQFSDGDYWLRLETGKPSFDVWGPGNLKSTNVLDANWHHVVGRFTRGTNDAWGTHYMEILVDGAVVATKSGRGATDTSDLPLFLGAYMGNSGFYAGLMDEIRLSRGLRSDAWLKATHAQQADPAAFLSVGPEQAGTRPGCAHQRTITINGAMVTGPLADFPVLVNLTDSFLREGVASANGVDLLFATEGGTELARELELFDRPSGRLVAWVKLPAVASGADTTFYVHYGNPAPAEPAFPATAVWDAGFMMVQHLEEAAGTVLDSTANGNDGVARGARLTEYGSANGGYEFDGKDDLIEVANDPTIQLNTGNFTMEGWFARKAMPADTIFTITARNAGPDRALNLKVMDALTPSFALVKTLATQGTYAMPPGLWDVGDLDEGGLATLRLAVKLNGLTMATNRAEVTACDSADPDSAPGNHQPGEDDQASAIGMISSGGGNPGKPDFSVSSISFVPATLTPNTAFTAVVTVVNRGAVAGNAGELNAWANRSAAANPGDAGDASYTVGLLAAGESRQVTLSTLRSPAANGSYAFRAFVDANNATVETSEGNNQKAVSYAFSAGQQPKPDFSVTSLSFAPAVLAPAIAFTAVVTVANSGSVAADAGLLKVWIHRTSAANPGEPSDGSQAVGILTPGQSRAFTFTGLRTPATNGNYKFRAFVDADNATIESSEGNNQKAMSYSFSSGYQPKPDFLITAISFSPANPARSNPFTAYVTVKNGGSVAADAGYADVWASKAATALPGETGDAWQGIGMLNANQSVQLVFDGLIAPTNGTKHTFRGFVDSHRTVTETSEGNNQAIKSYSY